MTLTELRYAVALEETRHFGQAAARCFVSQPTLSIAIRKLEDRLGVTLFATIVATVVLSTGRGRYDRFGDDLRGPADDPAGGGVGR